MSEEPVQSSGEQSRRFICPMPDPWAAVHQRLLKAWKRRGDAAIPEPPHPLILNGWVASSDAQKQARWAETIRWATAHGWRHLIPQIDERDAYQAPPGTRGEAGPACRSS